MAQLAVKKLLESLPEKMSRYIPDSAMLEAVLRYRNVLTSLVDAVLRHRNLFTSVLEAVLRYYNIFT
jgi:hypothetical protein